MRGHHQGSVYQRGADGRWFASISLPNGRRRTRMARTKEQAEEFLTVLLRETPRHHVFIKTGSRDAFADLIRRHLAWAAEEGWSQKHTAEVMSVSLSYTRIKFGICGPCVYCGTPKAGTVDHVRPVSRGGTDDLQNLVSSCLSCNTQKGSMDVGAFLSSRKRRRTAERSAEQASETEAA